MVTITIKRGLDVPLHGALASHEAIDRLDVGRVALLPQESWGIKVRLLVREGDAIQVGTPLFCDRRDETVLYTSPAAGTIKTIHRGDRRIVHSIVIEARGFEDAVTFHPVDLRKADRATVVAALAGSGLWPALRRRPFDRVASTTDTPRAIIVQAYDSSPLAPDLRELVRGREQEVKAGLAVLKALGDGPVHLAVQSGKDWSACAADGTQVTAFQGPHPSGAAGTSIHHLAPAGASRTTWYVGVQDVADIGRLFTTGKRPTTRLVAITGPEAKAPKLVRTRPGADIDLLLQGESTAREARVVNGSALWGTTANPATPTGFLGRYAHQVTLLENKVERDLLGWALPVNGRYTKTNTVFDKFFRKRFKFDTDTNGSLRAIVPIGVYESVMPLDVLPTQLIKSLACGDIEMAEKLGVLELGEEDLALCQFVDPCKVPITDWLRSMLTTIEKEG
jgi:Na+-transporting NADH:ubiquinone oxidoreductase subunit A